MKKNYILSLLAIFLLLPFTSLKAQYHAGDSTVCYNIMTNNFTAANLLNWNDPNPGNWLGVVWNTATPKRIIQLDIPLNKGATSGNSQGGDIGLFGNQQKPEMFNGSTVNSELTGIVDFSALSELVALDLRRQASITGINVSGLNKLEYFMMARGDGITSLDFSNLPNLKQIHTSNMDFITSIDASNCPRLKKLMVKRGSATLTNVNITGSDSLIFLMLKRSMSNTSPQTTLDLTGKNQLYYLFMADANISTIQGLNSLGKLRYMRMGNNNITGTINFNDFNAANFGKFGLKNNQLDSVAGWTSVIGSTSLNRMNVEANHLTLSNATQIGNEVVASSTNKSSLQIRYGGDTIPVGSSKDYSSQAVIDINGVNVTSNFVLHNVTLGTVVSTNNTGIFNFPNPTDVGEYYVGMSTPGGAPGNNFDSLTTNNFWVRCTSASAAQTLTICNEDSVVVGNNVFNTSGIHYSYFPVTNSCDSVYVTNLTVKPIITSNQAVTLCNGIPFTIGSSTYTTAGVYNDIFTAADGCDSTVTTNLSYLPALNTGVTASGLTLIANAIFDAGTTFQWVDCNNGNSVIGGATNPSYTPSVNGSYAVEITFNGCTETSACNNVIGVGINEYSTITANIYPNPFTNQFTIELGNLANDMNLSIVGVDGKLVYNQTNLHNNKLVIDATNWSKGIYIVKIYNNDETNTFKLVK